MKKLNFNNILLSFFSKKRPQKIMDNAYHFEAIMDAAIKMSHIEPNDLPKLVKLIARRIQANAMSAVLYYKSREDIDDNVPHLYPNVLLFDRALPLSSDQQQLHDFEVKTNYCRPLELKTDLLLPWPWSRDGIIGNLIGREKGTWRQDSNHQIAYWLPLGIGFVNGG